MLQKLFGFDPAQHEVRTEIYAGITTFLTMAYILAVNPSIFSALEPFGMPTSAVFTATVLASVVGSLAMALYAKKPSAWRPAWASTPSSSKPSVSAWVTVGSSR